MKKELIVLLFSCLLLTSCGSQTQSVPESTAMTDTEVAVATEPEDVTTYDTESQSPINLSTDEYNYLSEKLSLSSYAEVCAQALTQIGFTAVTDCSYDEVQISEDGDITMTVSVTDSNGKTVSMSCMYFSFLDDWSVATISDPDTGHLYLVPDGSEKYYDVYSYETGELISQKTEDISVEKIKADSNARTQGISDNYDKALDDIAEKYGIESNH